MSACLNTGFVPKPNTLVGFPFKADHLLPSVVKMYFKTKFSIQYNWEATHRVLVHSLVIYMDVVFIAPFTQTSCGAAA